MQTTETKKTSLMQQAKIGQRASFSNARNDSFSAKSKVKSSFSQPIIQTKLSIGKPDDKYEIEADRMADKVVSKSTAEVSNKPQTGPIIQKKCSTCDEEKHLQKKPLSEQIAPLVQRKTTDSAEGSVASQDVGSKINQSKGGGRPLGKNTMESGFGTDFSNVRIHTDTNAKQLNNELNAQAFTVGNDIYFNEGKYNPSSNSGKHLLAHELTHVVQQNSRPTIFSNGKNSVNKISSYPYISNATKVPAIQRKFMGTDSKNVEMEKGKTVKHILITSNNASPDLIELIRLVNASESEAAVDQVLKASRNDSEIHVKIELRRIKNGLYGLHQAHDKSGKALTWNRDKGDFDGIPEYASDGVYKSATITIFKGNLEKGGGNQSSHDSAGIKLTLEQLMAGTFSHETGHNTDKEFIDDLRKRREGKSNKGIDPHDNIEPLDKRVYQEIGDHSLSELVCTRDEELAARRIDALNAGRTFSKKDIDAAKEYFINNAKRAKKPKKGDPRRDGCLTAHHKGVKKFTRNDKLRLGAIDNTIDKTMDVLAKKGYAGEEQSVTFEKTEEGVEKGSPKKLKKSIWITLIELSNGDPGWSVFSMSLYDGNHSVTLILDANEPSAPIIYWADQWPSKGGWKEYKSPKGLDDEVTKRVKIWWKGNPAEGIKPKHFRQLVRLQRLRRFPLDGRKLTSKKRRQFLKDKEAKQFPATRWHHDLTKKIMKLEDETETTSTRSLKPDSHAQFGLSLGSHLRFSSDAETSAELALKFNYFLPLLLETKWRPFIYAGVHLDTGKKIGSSGGIGTQSDHLADMSLFLAGYAGLRTPTFNAVEFGGGLQAAWEFDKSRSLRLGIEWQTWLQMGDKEKRTHLLGLTIGKTFD